jgi:PPOX class probable F420-dependent enzyme
MMDNTRALGFLAQHHHSVLITRRADGSVQSSPVVHGVGGDGRVLISSTESRAKVRNIRRDPAVSLCALPDGFFGSWVQADGRATIVSLPDAMELLVETYRAIAGDHDDWDDYRAAMVRNHRCVIAIDVERSSGPGSVG